MAQNGYPKHEPVADVKRQILTAKRDQFRSQGYQYTIAEKVADRIGDKAQAAQARKLSQQAYEGARVCDEELAALDGEE